MKASTAIFILAFCSLLVRHCRADDAWKLQAVVTGGDDSWHSVFNANGHSFVTCYHEKLTVFDTVTAKPKAGPFAHDKVEYFRLSADGNRLFSSGGSDLRVWDVINARELWHLRLKSKYTVADMSLDGLRVLTVNRDDISQVSVFDVGTDVPCLRLDPKGVIISAEFDPSGEYVLCMALGGPYTIWRLDQAVQVGSPIQTDSDAQVAFTAVFDPVHERVALPMEREVWIAELKDASISKKIELPEKHYVTRVQLNGSQLTVGAQSIGAEACTHRFDSRTGAELDVFRHGVTEGQISPKCDWALLYSSAPEGDEVLEILDLKHNTVAKQFTQGTSVAIFTAQFSPDGRRLLVQTEEGKLELWSLDPSAVKGR